MFKPNQKQLASYLTAGLGAGCLAATADAAIVNLDVSSISGVNAGVSSGSTTLVSLATFDPVLTGSLLLANRYGGYTGILVSGGAAIAFGDNSAGYANPKNFSASEEIDGGAYWREDAMWVAFTDPETQSTSADFGSGSYIGFRSANGHYGWLEVTWDSASGNFEIFSGAFEDVAGVAIQAGAVAAVPEPASVLGTIGLLSAGMFVRRRRLAA